MSTALHPLEEASAIKALERDRWSVIVRESIRNTLIAKGELHCDDLVDLGVPEEHKNVIGAAIGRLVKHKLIEEVDRRPAAASASHKRKSGVFKPTAKGVAKLTGVDVAPSDEGGQRLGVGTPETRGVDPDETEISLKHVEGWRHIYDFRAERPAGEYWEQPVA